MAIRLLIGWTLRGVCLGSAIVIIWSAAHGQAAAPAVQTAVWVLIGSGLASGIVAPVRRRRRRRGLWLLLINPWQ